MTPHHEIRSVLLLALPLAAVALQSTASADVFTDIRYTDLVSRLGAATPTGAGIGIGQIEAPENAGGSYAPDTALAEFSGKTISLLSGTGIAPSWHATEVAKNLYGNTLSIAKGVSSISSWNVNPWITGVYLRVGSGSAVAPATPPAGVRVFNHSWIGSFGSTTSDNDALRRLDFTVTRDNIFVAAGTNNGVGSAAQPMMAYAFNGVTVGLADGNHANALTPAGIDGPSRRKPDIVAPGQFTSFATPVVGAAAALLFDTADSDPAVSANANANRALTVKAALMAGTTHSATWSNGAPTSGASRGVTATPLDPVYGAGLVNIDRAHRIFTGGEGTAFAAPQANTFERRRGWDYIPTVVANTSAYWSFRREHGRQHRAPLPAQPRGRRLCARAQAQGGHPVGAARGGGVVHARSAGARRPRWRRQRGRQRHRHPPQRLGRRRSGGPQRRRHRQRCRSRDAAQQLGLSRCRACGNAILRFDGSRHPPSGGDDLFSAPACAP